MTEELSEVEYKDGDIVWVKLSNRWWPGEVKGIEKISEEILESFRKPPLVVVKFFDEDTYEFVKSWAHIYPYNCEKKNEFIKKGMDHFRAKEQHMEKFPKDVSTAEFVTDGNPNILSDPMFLPEQKTNYSALFFGTPAKKPKDGSARKGRAAKNQYDKKDRTHVTHRRFLGFDDYEARIRIQTPEKHREETLLDDDEDEAKEEVKEEKDFSCQTCGFKTKLLEVIVLHSSSHIKGVYKTLTLSKRPTKSVLKKSKAAKAKRRSTDLGASSSFVSLSSGDESEKPSTKRKRKADEETKSAKQKKVAEQSVPQTVDLRNDLLAEWDDDFAEGDTTLESSQFDSSMETTIDDESEQLDTTVSVVDDSQSFTKESEKLEHLPDDMKSSAKDNRSDNKTDVADTVTSNGQDKPKDTSDKSKENKNKKVAISCFDFIEEEEQSSAMISPVAGRKIPRVIPPSERRKSDDEVCSSGDLFPTGTVADSVEDTDTASKKSQPSEKDHDDVAFNDLLASTAVPDLPDIPNTLKCEQNFHCASTIKYPDKTDSLSASESQSCSKSTESSSGIKLIPKKRYFQSLDDKSYDEQNKSVEAETPPETSKKANDFLDLGDTPEAAPNIESEFAESKEDSYEVKLENVMKQLPQDALECGDELEVTSQNVEINRTPFSSTETEETITKLSSLKSLDDEDIFDIPLAKMRKMSASHRTPRKSSVLETYLNAARESDSEKLKSSSQQGTSLQNESSNSDFTLNYDHKKMKYSKFSKALARQKVIESQESLKDPVKKPEETCSKYESIFGEKSNTMSSSLVLSSSVTSENNLTKAADGANVQKQSIKVSIPLQGKLDKDGSTDLKLPTKTFFPSHETTNKTEGCSSMKLLEMTRDMTSSPTGAANKDAPPLPDQKLSDTVIEDLFGDDNQKLLTEDIQSGMWNSENLSISLPAKPEFSSTSELMMELADGEKSSSSEELKFKKDEPTTDVSPESNEGACSTAEIEKILENETHCEVLKPLKQDEFNKIESESDFVSAAATPSTVTISPDEEAEKSETFDQVFSSDSLDVQVESSVAIEEGLDKVEEEKVENQDEDIVRETGEDKVEEKVKDKFEEDVKDKFEEEDKDKFEEGGKDRVEVEEVLYPSIDEEKQQLCELPSSEQVEKRTYSPDLFSQVSDIESNVYCSSEEVKSSIEETRPTVKKTRELCVSPDLFSQGSSVGYATEDVKSAENEKTDQVESSVEDDNPAEFLPSSDISKLEDESPLPDISKKQDESEYVLVSNIEDTDVSNNVEVTTVCENVPDDHIDESKSASTAEDQDCTVSEEKRDDSKNESTKTDDSIFDEEPSTEKSLVAVCSEKIINDQEASDDLSALKNSSHAMNISFEKAPSFFDEALGISPAKSSSFTCSLNDQRESDLGETIKTNLSTFSNNDELSALTTLAAVSELKDNLENNRSNALEEFKTLTSHTDTGLIPVGMSSSDLSEKISKEFLKLPEKTKKDTVGSDESSLLAAHEKALADSLMTANSVDNSISLSNFSMDYAAFSEESNNSQEVAPQNEKSNSKGNKFTSIKDSLASIPKTGKFNVQCASKPIIAKEAPAAPSAVCDLEDHIPPQIVCSKETGKALPLLKIKEITDSKSSRLLGILSDSTSSSLAIKRALMQKVKVAKPLAPTKSKPRPQKTPRPKTSKSKPIILSENIIKPADSLESVSVQKITSNSTYQDLEDIDTFIIKKNKAPAVTESNYAPSVAMQTIKSSGKAKILQQTIITPAGEIIQPNVLQQQTDDIMFDINSMPIVLSDGILTSEGMEKLPVQSQSVITTPIVTTAVATTTPSNSTSTSASASTPIIKKTIMQVTVPNKPTSQTTPLQAALTRAIAQTKAKISPKIQQSKMLKQAMPIGGSGPNRAGKYVIMPTALQQESKAMTSRKQYSAKKVQSLTLQKPAPVNPEPAKNKVMVFTHPSSGEKQRLLITPEQQKLIAERKKFTGTVIKGSLVQQKTGLKNQTIQFSPPGHSVAAARSVQNLSLATTANQITPTVPGNQAPTQTLKNLKIDMKGHKKLVQIPTQRVQQIAQPAIQKTVLLKNQSGQPRKYHSPGADKSLLDQQVAEQVEAIKISQAWKQQKSDFPSSKLIKPVNRRSFIKSAPSFEAISQSSTSRIQTTSASPPMKAMSIVADSSIVPPLNPLPPRKTETITKHTIKQESKKPKEIPAHQSKTVAPVPSQAPAPQVNQIVIQDQLGNQTPVAVGQILALPSETVDGQAQSYILVTVDEAGNFTPLSSDALMSLDPSLGSDLSNMFVQYDAGSISSNQTTQASSVQIKAAAPSTEVSLPREKPPMPKPPVEKPVSVKSSTQRNTTAKAVMPEVSVEPSKQPVENPLVGVQQMPVLETGQQQQQLVVTGDPEATKKFLESLSDGTTDLSSILANAEGGSIVIQTDGQQIIINTDPNNQSMMIPGMSGDIENCEGSGNPMFSSQPKKTTDILAAALAGTDVFQQDHHPLKGPSQLSPNSTLYPMNVGNVLEPTLTLSSPIMTPLEVPSNNSKKVPDNEADILTHIPKNVDLPITITDPNISQTVAQQQVASLIASELQSNLELLTTETSVLSTVASSSDTYSYSLPTFDDDAIELSSKSFNSSMPLLTEDGENLSSAPTVLEDKIEDISKEEIKDITPTSQTTETDDHCPISLSLKDDIEASTSSAEMSVSSLEIPRSHAEIPSSPIEISSSIEVATSSLELSKHPEDISSRNPVDFSDSPVEISRSSVEILGSPAEIPTSSAELLTSSAEILTSSTEIVTSPAEILTSSTEILTSPVEIMTSSTEILTSSTEILTSSAEISTSSAESLISAADIPTSSVEILTSSTEILTSSVETPVAAEIPTSSVEISISDAEIPTGSAEISISEEEIPATTSVVEIPTSSVEISISSTEAPNSPAEISTSSVEMPKSPAEIPISSAEIPVSSSEILVSSAEIPTSFVEIPRSPVELHRSIVEVEISPIPDKVTLSPSIHSEDSGDEGLCTLGGEMCNSLSEPPPDMFELDTLTDDDRMSSSIFSGSSFNLMSNAENKRDECASSEPLENESLERETVRTKVSRMISEDELKPDSTSSTDFHNEDSCEIPILPPIVTTIVSDESSNSGSDRNIFRDKV